MESLKTTFMMKIIGFTIDNSVIIKNVKFQNLVSQASEQNNLQKIINNIYFLENCKIISDIKKEKFEIIFNNINCYIKRYTQSCRDQFVYRNARYKKYVSANAMFSKFIIQRL